MKHRTWKSLKDKYPNNQDQEKPILHAAFLLPGMFKEFAAEFFNCPIDSIIISDDSRYMYACKRYNDAEESNKSDWEIISYQNYIDSSNVLSLYVNTFDIGTGIADDHDPMWSTRYNLSMRENALWIDWLRFNSFDIDALIPTGEAIISQEQSVDDLPF